MEVLGCPGGNGEDEGSLREYLGCRMEELYEKIE
jgi:hypothetical protein